MLAIGIYTYRVWTAPYRVMQKFVKAVELRDARTIISLSYPLEQEIAGLTTEAVHMALNRIFSAPVRQVGPAQPSAGRRGGWRGNADRTSPLEGTLCEWDILWEAAGTARPLVGTARRQHRFSSPIIVKPTAQGWRVLVGEFLRSACISQYDTYQAGRQAFVYTAANAGISAYVDTSDELWEIDPRWGLRRRRAPR
jgi:hypothetical protein